MLITKRLAIFPVLLLTTIAPAQQPAPTSAIKTVEVKASVTEAEVGQKVKLIVVAKHSAGKVVNEQPSTYFAGPFDIAARVIDVSGELRGDLYRHGREIGRLWTGDPESYRPNLPFTWGAQPHKGLIYFNDINSGLWVVKLGPKIDKGSTTSPGQ